MVNQPLLTLINSILGKGKQTSKGNYAYHCPKCEHHKLKLEINLDSSSSHYQSFACWVCGFKGKKLTTLFKQIEASSTAISELRSLVKSNTSDKEIIVEEQLILPKEFTPLLNIHKSNIIGRHALKYIKSRNINEDDIIKYNIGYCESGLYKNMIIIPSYDENGKLNYFTGRSFQKEPSIKYKNPQVSRDIIPFELFINWNIPLILCEGPFDAIAIKRNAIPLLGKNIQSNLMKKIVMSNVEKIYIALDKDAQKQALSFCERLMSEGKEVYLIDMVDKDPSEMGFEHFTYLIQNTIPLTFSTLLQKKMHM